MPHWRLIPRPDLPTHQTTGGEPMLNVFSLANGRLYQEEIESLQALSQLKPVWVDLESPSPDELQWIEQHFGVVVPANAMDEDNE
jgi:magnesium transporter